MCGIFGIQVKENANVNSKLLRRLTNRLAILSESRGKESAGFAIQNCKTSKINVIKAPIPASEMIKNDQFNKYFNEALQESSFQKNGDFNKPFIITGQSRLVTDGSSLIDENNQPTYKSGIVGLHNGIITNVNQLWEKYNFIKRDYEVDTEVMLAMVRYYYDKNNSLISSISKVFSEVEGTISTILLCEDSNDVLYATNNGSLYILIGNPNIVVFASERYILKKFVKDHNIKNLFHDYEIKQVIPNTGYIINLNDFNINKFVIDENNTSKSNRIKNDKNKFKTKITKYNVDGEVMETLVNPFRRKTSNIDYLQNLLEYNIEEIKNLKRCTKCLLPETFPFLEFDNDGVCNVCRYSIPGRNKVRPIEELVELVEPYRSKDGSQDCIIGFSGGRDSSFVTQLVKTKLKLNPLTFTWDWAMVTDLARRNVARICGKLGIEHIIMSADIRKMRQMIHENVLAWLKKPDLGMVPLFMTCEKDFFLCISKLRKQTGIKLNFIGVNYLENTDFKTGFAGVDFEFDKETVYSLNFKRKLKLWSHISKNVITNPSYINSSMYNSFKSFYSRYFNPKIDHFDFYNYYKWDEKEVEETLFNEYNWEKAHDVKSTWRIDDGTASFYNYIYYTVAGFSEFDTFRSNQIREGSMTRDEALSLVYEENIPRYDSIKWYLDVINVDFETAIKTINKIPKLYRT